MVWIDFSKFLESFYTQTICLRSRFTATHKTVIYTVNMQHFLQHPFSSTEQISFTYGEDHFKPTVNTQNGRYAKK